MLLCGSAGVSVPLADSHAVLPSHVPGWALVRGPISTCPDGQRNAFEEECLAAVARAARKAGLQRVRGLKHLNSTTTPVGCSYNVDTKTAEFNSELQGHHHAGHQLPCHTDEEATETRLWRWPWQEEEQQQGHPPGKQQGTQQGMQEQDQHPEQQQQQQPTMKVQRPPMGGATVVTSSDVGGWGGSCTCPDGTLYYAGDNRDDCGSLACIGGTPGKCHKTFDVRWRNRKVTCGGAGEAPLSIVVVMGQSNIEPGHGDVSRLTDDQVQRVRRVADRAEVCGRHCTQAHVWAGPIVSEAEWPGEGCVSHCVNLGELLQPPDEVLPAAAGDDKWWSALPPAEGGSNSSLRPREGGFWAQQRREAATPAAAPPSGVGYTFGPELSLALHIAEAETGRRVRIIKFADPGHGLDQWVGSGFMQRLAIAQLFKYWSPRVDQVGFVWSHGEIDENTQEQEARAGQWPGQKLTFDRASAYGSRLGQLIRELRQQAYRASCSHEACITEEDVPFVMVEPWIGAASSCEPSAESREAHRLIVDGVRRANEEEGWKNFVQLNVDRGGSSPLHVQRFCNYEAAACNATPGCAAGKGHFDTGGQLKLGKLLAGWHLRRWWDTDAHWWMMP